MKKSNLNEPELAQFTTLLFEPYLELKVAALALGLPYHALQRGIRQGIFPAYRFGRRLRVRLSEIVAIIEATRLAGAK